MKSSEFHRDGDKVTASLKELGNTLVTLTGCKVYFPVSFENYKLAAFDGSDVKVLGACIIALEDKSYGISECQYQNELKTKWGQYSLY